MPRPRILFLSAATLTFLNISVVAQAQYLSVVRVFETPGQTK